MGRSTDAREKAAGRKARKQIETSAVSGSNFTEQRPCAQRGQGKNGTEEQKKERKESEKSNGINVPLTNDFEVIVDALVVEVVSVKAATPSKPEVLGLVDVAEESVF